MNGFKIVYHNGMSMLVADAVMDQMGLRVGQSVAEVQVWRIVELNTAALVADMDMLRIAGEKNVPDTSSLKASLARIAAKR